MLRRVQRARTTRALAPKEYHELYDADKPPLPANFLPQHPFNNGDLTVRDERLAPWPRTPEVVRQHLADYYASITFLDAQIGRILDALQASGQDDDTIIVFTSDHGLAIGSHGLFGKQNLYDALDARPADLRRPWHPARSASPTRCATCSTSSRRWASWPACRAAGGQRGQEPGPRS